MRTVAARARRMLLVAVVLGTAMLTALSCDAEQRPTDRAPETRTPVNDAIADPASVPPGTLLESTPFTAVDVRVHRAGAHAKRIVYRSTSGLDGSATTVTGAVFIPRAKPPRDTGWPVVAYAHPGVGILPDCGPSQHADLLGSGSQIEMLLNAGYLVVMTDYQGLGGEGPHPYLEPTTLAYNVIDSVRAARQLEPGAGVRWAAYGGAEGGEAAWAAAELAPTYGQGLDMVGAVALAPTANMSAMPQVALDRKLNYEQLPLMQYIANAVSSVRPDIRLDDYLRGFARQNNDALLQCAAQQRETRNQLFAGVSPDDVAPTNQEAADALAGVLRSWSLPGPSAPAQVPILVLIGSHDGTTWTDWVRTAARQACERGEQISWILRPAEGHDNLNVKQSLPWLTDRFRGIPVQGACIIT